MHMQIFYVILYDYITPIVRRRLSVVSTMRLLFFFSLSLCFFARVTVVIIWLISDRRQSHIGSIVRALVIGGFEPPSSIGR